MIVYLVLFVEVSNQFYAQTENAPPPNRNVSRCHHVLQLLPQDAQITRANNTEQIVPNYVLHSHLLDVKIGVAQQHLVTAQNLLGANVLMFQHRFIVHQLKNALLIHLLVSIPLQIVPELPLFDAGMVHA